jgi:hypothetical protein
MDLWTEASRDRDEEHVLRALSAARANMLPYWGLIATATNDLDLDNRLALLDDRITLAAEAAAEAEEVTYAPLRNSLVASLRQDWQVVAQQRRTATKCSDCGQQIYQDGEGGSWHKGGADGPTECPRGGTHTPSQGDSKESRRVTAVRPLSEIAAEIEADWGSKGSGVNFGARPYLDAMYSLNSINDAYGADDGEMIVAYFLSNARSWTGEVAKRIKAELKSMSRYGRLAASDMTCAKCGDSITKDPAGENPSTWHHDNGEKHDHEAQPYEGSDEQSKADLNGGVTSHSSRTANENRPCTICGSGKADHKDNKCPEGSGTYTPMPEGGTWDQNTGSDGEHKESARRRLAAEGQTCEVCGDSIGKDPAGENPSTWHHTNGTSHDHEAKPKAQTNEDRSNQMSSDTTSARVQALRGGGIPFVRTASDDEGERPCGCPKGDPHLSDCPLKTDRGDDAPDPEDFYESSRRLAFFERCYICDQEQPPGGGPTYLSPSASPGLEGRWVHPTCERAYLMGQSRIPTDFGPMGLSIARRSYAPTFAFSTASGVRQQHEGGGQAQVPSADAVPPQQGARGFGAHDAVPSGVRRRASGPSSNGQASGGRGAHLAGNIDDVQHDAGAQRDAERKHLQPAVANAEPEDGQPKDEKVVDQWDKSEHSDAQENWPETDSSKGTDETTQELDTTVEVASEKGPEDGGAPHPERTVGGEPKPEGTDPVKKEEVRRVAVSVDSLRSGDYVEVTVNPTNMVTGQTTGEPKTYRGWVRNVDPTFNELQFTEEVTPGDQSYDNTVRRNFHIPSVVDVKKISVRRHAIFSDETIAQHGYAKGYEAQEMGLGDVELLRAEPDYNDKWWKAAFEAGVGDAKRGLSNDFYRWWRFIDGDRRTRDADSAVRQVNDMLPDFPTIGGRRTASQQPDPVYAKGWVDGSANAVPMSQDPAYLAGYQDGSYQHRYEGSRTAAWGTTPGGPFMPVMAVEAPSCPACGGEGKELGSLGKRKWFRCRDCGIEFNEQEDEEAKEASRRVEAREWTDAELTLEMPNSLPYRVRRLVNMRDTSVPLYGVWSEKSHEFVAESTNVVALMDDANRWNRNPGLAPDQFDNDWYGFTGARQLPSMLLFQSLKRQAMKRTGSRQVLASDFRGIDLAGLRHLLHSAEREQGEGLRRKDDRFIKDLHAEIAKRVQAGEVEWQYSAQPHQFGPDLQPGQDEFPPGSYVGNRRTAIQILWDDYGKIDDEPGSAGYLESGHEIYVTPAPEMGEGLWKWEVFPPGITQDRIAWGTGYGWNDAKAEAVSAVERGAIQGLARRRHAVDNPFAGQTTNPYAGEVGPPNQQAQIPPQVAPMADPMSAAPVQPVTTKPRTMPGGGAAPAPDDPGSGGGARSDMKESV